MSSIFHIVLFADVPTGASLNDPLPYLLKLLLLPPKEL